MFHTIPTRTRSGAKRITLLRKALDTLWINTGSRCPYQCPHCHLQSGPRNSALEFITPEDCEKYLHEYASHNAPKIKTVGLTGGEPFMNPAIVDIMTRILEDESNFHLLILTSATYTMHKKWKKLQALFQAHGQRITVRVSIDHPQKHRHCTHRHNPHYNTEPAIWEPMIRGLRLLLTTPCTVGVTGYLWPNETETALRAEYRALFATMGATLHDDAITLFPSEITNYDCKGVADMMPNGITQKCLELYQKQPDDLMCATSLMVVKGSGDVEASIAPCTIIPYNKNYRVFGKTLKEIMQTPMPLAHKNCAWCLAGGHCNL